MIEHELRRMVLPRPLEKKGERGVAMGKGRGVRECPVKRVEFAEVGQMREVVAQEGPVQRRLEGLPTQRLRCLGIAERLENADFQSHAVAIATVVTCRPVADVLQGHDAQARPPRSAHPLKSVGRTSRSKEAFCDPYGILSPRGPA